MKKPSFLFLPVLFIFLASAGFAQLSSAKIDSLVTNALAKFKVAGAAIAIVKDGKIIHQKGYGVTSVINKQPVNEFTNFAIASNSKAFTTAALAMLVEEGKVKWMGKVKDYIPEFKMYDDYVTENFTIKDLLTHRSGLGLGAGDLMGFPDGTDFTIKDIIHSLRYFKPVSAFRTKFDYDNSLYFVAGEVIARTGGMSYEDFVQKRILAPLKMEHSFAAPEMMKDKSNLATPHSSESGEIKAISHFKEIGNSAAGGILSNVADMSAWMIMHLNNGKYGSDLQSKLFSAASHDDMWAIQTVLPANRSRRYNTHFSGYGLGWFLQDIKGNLMASHTGGLPGMLSQVTMIPDLNLGIVVLTNTENGGGALFQAVTNTITDSYLGLEDFGWVEKYYTRLTQNRNAGDEVTKKVWAKVDSSKNSMVKNDAYIGVYEDNWFGKAEVFLKGKQLWFRSYRSPKLNGPMAFYNANSFAIKWEYQDMNADAFAIFSLDENGKAQSIKMKGISPNIDFSFDFQDLDLVRVK